MLKEIKNKATHHFRDENDIAQGEYKTWFDNGDIRMHCFFIDGKVNGEFKMWRKNSQIYEHSFYVNGDRHGECKLWHTNGILSLHCLFMNGKQHGEYKSWKPSGKLETHCFFSNGDYACVNDLPLRTPEDRMYFVLKYNLPLLPVEQTC